VGGCFIRSPGTSETKAFLSHGQPAKGHSPSDSLLSLRAEGMRGTGRGRTEKNRYEKKDRRECRSMYREASGSVLGRHVFKPKTKREKKVVPRDAETDTACSVESLREGKKETRRGSGRR